MEEADFFIRKRVVPERLVQYGFERLDEVYRFSTKIMEGQFLLLVAILKEGMVDTQVIDIDSGEEYVLHRVPNSVGSFTGAVREAYNSVMLDIGDKCFEPDVFTYEQSREIIAYVKNTYGDELEFLWEKSPNSAIWRRKDNRKWYGVLLTVAKQKLGFDSTESVEIIDLRIQSDKIEGLLDGMKYFPGYHMNKKTWFTIILDGTVPLKEICNRIDTSYSIALK